MIMTEIEHLNTMWDDIYLSEGSW